MMDLEKFRKAFENFGINAVEFVDTVSEQTRELTPTWVFVSLILLMITLHVFVRSREIRELISAKFQDISLSPINIILYIMTGVGAWRLFYEVEGPDLGPALLKIIELYAESLDMVSAFLSFHWNNFFTIDILQIQASNAQLSYSLVVLSVGLRLLQLMWVDFRKGDLYVMESGLMTFGIVFSIIFSLIASVLLIFQGDGIYAIRDFLADQVFYVILALPLFVGWFWFVVCTFCAPLLLFFYYQNVLDQGIESADRKFRWFFPILRWLFSVISVGSLHFL